VRKLVWVDRIASGLLLLAPVILILVQAPFLFGLQIVAGLALLTARIAVHVVTLPVELDASFGKLCQCLREVAICRQPTCPRPHRAASRGFTYVASALMTLLNIARWFRILRF